MTQRKTDGQNISTGLQRSIDTSSAVRHEAVNWVRDLGGIAAMTVPPLLLAFGMIPRSWANTAIVVIVFMLGAVAFPKTRAFVWDKMPGMLTAVTGFLKVIPGLRSLAGIMDRRSGRGTIEDRGEE